MYLCVLYYKFVFQIIKQTTYIYGIKVHVNNATSGYMSLTLHLLLVIYIYLFIQNASDDRHIMNAILAPLHFCRIQQFYGYLLLLFL